jgi:predicted DNA-binding WGR domain protein
MRTTAAGPLVEGGIQGSKGSKQPLQAHQKKEGYKEQRDANNRCRPARRKRDASSKGMQTTAAGLPEEGRMQAAKGSKQPLQTHQKEEGYKEQRDANNRCRPTRRRRDTRSKGKQTTAAGPPEGGGIQGAKGRKQPLQAHQKKEGYKEQREANNRCRPTRRRWDTRSKGKQ